MLVRGGKRARMAGFGLLGVLLGMTLAAGEGACVLAGCRGEQQRGQYDTATYQISLPLNWI